MNVVRQAPTLTILALLIALAASATCEANPPTAYGRLPLSFEPNHGQVDPSVGFVARSTGYQLFLTPDQAVLVMRRPGAVATDALRMALVGATPQRPQGVDRLPGTVNYLTGNDPTGWRTSIPTYAKVLLREVYPGIDLVYYGNGRQLEYDFILAPGADPASIQLSIRGLTMAVGAPLALDASGDLTLRVSGGEVLLKRPIAYQLDEDGQRRPIDVAYVLVGPTASEADPVWRVAFALGAYDQSRPLVIDPVVSYARYLGGTAEDAAVAVAVREAGADSTGEGEAYVTGYTDSLNFPTAGAARGDAPGRDAFVARLDVAGTALLYATYLGGGGRDEGTGIAVEAGGNAYVTGFTHSTNFPTMPGTPLQGSQGGRDAFVAKLNKTGGLIYSTYLGGGLDDEGLGIAVDALGSAYVTGWTDSTDFPTTRSAFQGDQKGRDAFVAKLNPGGTMLLYSTYLGGSGDDEGWGIVPDSAGMAYVTGETTSTDLPITGNARDSGGGRDAFVGKLDTTKSGTDSGQYLTYFGGSGADAGRGIAVDLTGLIHVTGYTTSADFPTKFAYQTTHGGGQDAFVAKFNPAGAGPNQTLSYSSYLGGSGNEVGQAIAGDEEGQVYIAGFTESADFPTRQALDTTLGGSKDAFVAKFDPLDPGLPSLLYSTYLGGAGEDEGHGVALDAGGNAYVVGLTRSATFPGAVGSVSGPADAFVAKLSDPDLVVSVLTVPAFGGAGEVLRVNDTTKNQGLVRADASITGFYVSTDSRLNPALDILVGSREVPGLDPGEENSAETPLTLPATLATGTYFLFARADDTFLVPETLESNNRTRRTFAVGADLLVSVLNVSSSGRTVTVQETTKNAGGARVTIPTTTKYFIAGPSGEVALGSRTVGALDPGGESAASTEFPVPNGVPVGSFTVTVRADADGAVGETNETNNANSRPLGLGVDLVVSALRVPSVSGFGTGSRASFDVTSTTANQGAFEAPASTTEFFLTTTGVIDAEAVRIGTQAVGKLAPGANTGEVTTALTIPQGKGVGSRLIVARANGGTPPVAETNTNNNTRARGTVIGPDLSVTFVSPETINTGPGKTITVKETTRNLGGGEVPASMTKFYLSTNATWEPSDIELGQRTVPRLGGGLQHFSGEPPLTGVALTIPANTQPGNYFLIIRANAGATALEETDATNNTRTATLAVSGGSDLVVSSLTVALGEDSKVTATAVIKNQGSGQAVASTTRFYVSTDDTFNEATATVLGNRAVGPLAADASSEVKGTFQLPGGVPPASLTIFAKADAAGEVPESDETNNVRLRTVDTRGSDLIVSRLLFSWEGPILKISDTTRNEGPAEAGASVTRFYLSKDAIWDANDEPLGPGRNVNALAAARQNERLTSVTIPATTAGGEYFLIAKADAASTIGETNETNNTFAVPITIRPDLLFVEYNLPSGGVAGQNVQVSGTVRNAGPIPAGASVIKVYLSPDATLSATDTLLATVPFKALTAGETEPFAATITLPANLEGTVSIIARLDANDQIIESETGKTNNTRVKSLTSGTDLIISAVSGPSPSVAAAGGTFSVNVTTRNQTGTTAGASTTGLYLSTDAVHDAGDVSIGSRPVLELGARRSDAGPAPVTIPPGTASGKYFVIAVADAANAVKETREDNNSFRPEAPLAAAFPIVIGPDLVVSISAPASVGSAGTLTVTDNTRNQGGAQADGSDTRFYLSTNATFEPADILLGSRIVGLLDPGTASSGATELTIPGSTAPGMYRIIARTDAAGTVIEADEDNNVGVSGPVVVGPDLVVSALSVPIAAVPGTPIKITETVANAGGVQGGQAEVKIFLSADAVVGAGDVMIGSRIVPPLAPGTHSEVTSNFLLPGNVPIGVLNVIARVEVTGQLEADQNNNTRAASLKIGPDLQVASLSAPTIVAPGTSILIKHQTRNQGTAAGGSVTRFHLSRDAILDSGDTILGDHTVGNLALGGAIPGETSVLLPTGIVGSFHIIAQANATGTVIEAVSDNNTRSVAVSVGPDFTVNGVTAPNTAGIGATITVGATIKNIGAASGPSVTQFFLSADETLSGGDIPLGSANVVAIPAGNDRAGSTSVTLPANLAAGTYQIIAKANGNGAVTEANPDNNTKARPIVVGPDLVLLDLTLPANAGAGLTVTLRDVIRNDGAGTAPASTMRYYLSTSDILDSQAVLLGSREVPALAPGVPNEGSTPVTIPAGTKTGTYSVFALADATGLLSETKKENNVRRSKQVKIGPDITISTWTVPGSAAPGSTIALSATLANLGGGNAGPFTVRAYLSADVVVGPEDVEIGNQNFNGLAAGASSPATAISVKIPDGISGPFNVILVADTGETVAEILETNNVRTKSLNIRP